MALEDSTSYSGEHQPLWFVAMICSNISNHQTNITVVVADSQTFLFLVRQNLATSLDMVSIDSWMTIFAFSNALLRRFRVRSHRGSAERVTGFARPGEWCDDRMNRGGQNRSWKTVVHGLFSLAWENSLWGWGKKNGSENPICAFSEVGFYTLFVAIVIGSSFPFRDGSAPVEEIEPCEFLSQLHLCTRSEGLRSAMVERSRVSGTLTRRRMRLVHFFTVTDIWNTKNQRIH